MDMRVALGMTAVSVVLVSLPALGQQWSDYINPQYRFRVNFPTDPTEQDAIYTSADGTSHDARAFFSDQDAGRYRVLVVQFPSDLADMAGEFDHAAEPYRQLGEVVYDQAGEYEGIDAYEINVIDPDGRQIYVSFAYHEQRLFIAEGNVDADSFPPIQFQQSLWITDGEGNPINGGRRLGN